MPATYFNLPQNQVDALPIQQGGGLSGSIVGVPFGFTRYWSPAVTGINGAVPAINGDYPVPANSFLVTNFFDVTGCNNFVMLIVRSYAVGVSAFAQPLIVYIQYQFEVGGVFVTPPHVSGPTENGGIQQISNPAINYGADGSLAGGRQYQWRGFGNGDIGPGGGYPRMMGTSRARLFLEWPVNPAGLETPAGSSSIAFSLWGGN